MPQSNITNYIIRIFLIKQDGEKDMDNHDKMTLLCGDGHVMDAIRKGERYDL